jgi:hypothetical protein
VQIVRVMDIAWGARDGWVWVVMIVNDVMRVRHKLCLSIVMGDEGKSGSASTVAGAFLSMHLPHPVVIRSPLLWCVEPGLHTTHQISKIFSSIDTWKLVHNVQVVRYSVRSLTQS